MRKKLSLQTMIEVALMAAVAFVIDLLVPTIKPTPSIYLNFSMIAIFILAFRRGVFASAVAGIIWGALQIFTGEAEIIHPVQTVMEYIFALASISVAGLFKGRIQKNFKEGNRKNGILFAVLAIIAGSFARYFWHFLAGFIFWTKLFEMPMKAGILYSLWTNSLSGLGSAILSAIIVVILLSTSPRLIKEYL